MTSQITSASVDLDLLFAPHVTNSSSATGVLVAGVDISSRYDIISNPDLSNAGARIPAINLTGIGGINLASIFCGNASQYSLTTPSGGTQSTTGWTSPKTWTNTIVVTFANATALTNYFYYGGRIQISPTQSVGTVADNTLAAMFSSMGTLVIYDQGHYRTGVGGAISFPSVGGANIGTTGISLFNITDGSPYTATSYTVSMVANAAAGSSTILTITTVLTIATAGTIADTYTGTYTSNVQQRNHSTQSLPLFSSSMA